MRTTLRFEDLACPRCGYRQQFHIDVSATAHLDRFGLKVESDYIWNHRSCCTCLSCGFEAPACEFDQSQHAPT